MKKFTLGAIAGMSSLALAVPLLAQMSNAKGGGMWEKNFEDMPAPTQECLQAMVALEDAHLANFDAMTAVHKDMMQDHADKLREVAAIADDAARKEALKALHEEMRAMKDDETFTPPAAITAAMDAVKEACGDTMMFMKHAGGPGPRMMMGHGPKMMKMHWRADDGAMMDAEEPTMLQQ